MCCNGPLNYKTMPYYMHLKSRGSCARNPYSASTTGHISMKFVMAIDCSQRMNPNVMVTQ